MSEHRINQLGHHGDGIADGPLYVPMSLPGEIVSGTVEGQTLSDRRILVPSPDRVTAPCPHFKSCGGCALQHASDTFVAGWKEDVVRKALEAHGITTEFRPMHTSDARSRRRATFAAKRTKKGATAGFYGRGTDVVVEIPKCLLLHPDLIPGIEIARELALLGASRKAALAVTITLCQNGLDVAVAHGKPLDASLQVSLAGFCRNHSIVRLTWNDDLIAMENAPIQQFGRSSVVPPPGAFLQATKDGETALLDAVKEAVAGATRVADLFCGSGTFALPLAEQARIHAVEAEANMVDALEKGWRGSNGLKPVTVETRDLFRRPLLPDELSRFDAVVLDPPRAGASQQVAEIAKTSVPRIAYVSCNPITFAKDVAVLCEGGYSLDWVKVVDQFRWSPHVELASSLTLRD